LLGHSSGEHPTQIAVLDHVGAGAVALQLRVETEEMRAQGDLERAVGDLDRLHYLGLGRQLRPEIERAQEVLGRSREGKRAGILAAAGFGRLGIDQSDAKPIRRELGKRERKRAPGKAAAGDRHVEALPAFDACSGHRPAMPRSVSRVNLLKGSAIVTKGLAHEPRAGAAAVHPRPRTARGESVPRA
jgi:hypothetical protein